ncbi:MAG: fumarate/nitrate reduction transcriptional regulator Fnr [Acidiferrobacterales bacterium]
MENKKIIDFPAIQVACQNCRLSSLCLPAGLDGADVDKLDTLIRRASPLRRGDYLFRTGDTMKALYALRSGTMKSFTISPDGQEKVFGFHLPGELLGFDGIGTGQHQCTASALDTSSICQLPVDRLQNLAEHLPSLSWQLQRLMGQEIVREHEMLLLLSQMNAQERLAAFLLNLSERFGQRGLSNHEFYLGMARQDIANYLGLTLETVSRTFSQFQHDGLIAVERRHIQILDRGGLAALAGACCSPSSRVS